MLDRLFNKPLESARLCLKRIVKLKAAAYSTPNKTFAQEKRLACW